MKKILALLLALTLFAALPGCVDIPEQPRYPEYTQPSGTQSILTGGSFDYSTVPAYSGDAYAAVHDNIPYFTEADLTAISFEDYGELDALNRCGMVWASIGPDLMPTEERGPIGSVKPTGWQTVRYDGLVDGNYLYNRCHLIGFQLTGENANERNLITGTRYLNVEGMLPFEDMVADYIKETGNHVLYRVTPVFIGEELVARGVLMEGFSVEDGGEGICFCVFAYNVQPDIEIDYATGESWLAEMAQTTGPEPVTYVLNTNTEKFHYPDCPSVENISAKNRRDFTGTREELVSQGYEPCGRCKP